ncbi:hypothetical protein T02_13071 [Trichinella nativa]|uniref:Uncharacterized protein n=1 Tax=Trichinella nativa TaxID=6335 RepID=A0A0V1KH07_9BILA|nr:hypothetical protein T02_13071 [Trichinella nativa]
MSIRSREHESRHLSTIIQRKAIQTTFYVIGLNA